LNAHNLSGRDTLLLARRRLACASEIERLAACSVMHECHACLDLTKAFALRVHQRSIEAGNIQHVLGLCFDRTQLHT
jgi:hypothetical protein